MVRLNMAVPTRFPGRRLESGGTMAAQMSVLAARASQRSMLAVWLFAAVSVSCARARDADPDGAQGSSTGDLVDGGLEGSLRLEPEQPVLVLSLPLSGQTIPFRCLATDTGKPAESATFSLSSSELGSVSSDGVFTPNGLGTGQVTVSCGKGSASAKTLLRQRIHAVDTDSSLTLDQISTLRQGEGASDPKFHFLYPYDETVFPQGTPAPEIHLSTGSAPGEAFYVSIAVDDLVYEGFFNASAKNTQLHISQPAWNALTAAAGGKKVAVRVAKLSQGKKYGPITRSIQIAPGKLHGTIYYNTYDSLLAQKTGAVMRIKGSASSPEVLIGGCTGCHGVSSDGSTLAAANHAGPGGIFDLSSAAVDPPAVWQEPERAAFGALYPKGGEVMVTSAMPGSYWPPNTPGSSIGPWASELRSRSGMLVPGSGIEGFYAQTPAFSHDGTRLAFTNRDPVPPHSSALAVLSYNAVAHKFNGYDVLATPKPGHHLAWPAFTPDGKYVLYQDGRSDDLATWKDSSSLNEGRLFAVDVQTNQVTYLLKLNGDGAMPAGARDEAKNFMPTVAPVASGGYFWVMFTSRRTYGNKLTGSDADTKRLWVAAFDISAPPGVDPSHPAFYLPGQELESGNTRGFWVLDPCKSDDATCESGDECCGGRCAPKGSPPELRCSIPDSSCSREFEVCAKDGDCCGNASLACINGKCALIPPK